jgi:hypothetical protein
MMKMNRALETLSNRSSDATKIANRHRDEEHPRRFDMKSYREGEAIAYNDAYKIVKAELQRLRNEYQNGCLTIDSFDIPF